MTAALFWGAGSSSKKTQTFCDNSLCLDLPVEWSVRTDYGGIAIRIIAAPFQLPSWVGDNREGVIDIPHGQFVLMVMHLARGRIDDSPRVRALSVFRDRVRREPSSGVGDRSLVTRDVIFRNRSVNIAVYFEDTHPASDQIDRANAVLATARLAPPQPTTQ